MGFGSLLTCTNTHTFASLVSDYPVGDTKVDLYVSCRTHRSVELCTVSVFVLFFFIFWKEHLFAAKKKSQFCNVQVATMGEEMILF